jgi:Tfp pilus assembly protein PilN
MSLAFLTKPIGGSKKDASADPDKPGQGRVKPGPVRGGAGSNVTVGGAPRVDLMPPEIRAKRSQLRTRRSLRLALFGVFVLVVVACGATWAWNALAQTSLASAQARQQALLAQQAKYSSVTTIQNATTLIKAGQVIGDSTEIDWQTYLTKLQATLPAGVQLTVVDIGTADPMTAYAQSTTPLQGGRIATLSFTATSSSLPSIPAWLDGLRTLPGFVDATPGSVSLADGVYSADVTMHIGPEAFANRFDPKKKDAAGTDTSTGTDTSSDGGN